MNDMTTTTSQVPADMDMSGFDVAIGELSTGDPVVRFINGKWKWQKSGDEKLTLEMGQSIAANLFQTERGWLHFGTVTGDDGNEVIVLDEKRLGKVAEKYRPERREDLGDNDQGKWRKGTDGKLMDPWVHVWQFPSILIGQKGNYAVQVSGTSMGWERTICGLFTDWKAQLPMNTGKVPIIELHAREGKTKHGDRDFPVMNIVGWKGLDEFEVNKASDVSAAEPAGPKPAVF